MTSTTKCPWRTIAIDSITNNTDREFIWTFRRKKKYGMSVSIASHHLSVAFVCSPLSLSLLPHTSHTNSHCSHTLPHFFLFYFTT